MDSQYSSDLKSLLSLFISIVREYLNSFQNCMGCSSQECYGISYTVCKWRQALIMIVLIFWKKKENSNSKTRFIDFIFAAISLKSGTCYNAKIIEIMKLNTFKNIGKYK